jgi:hypothetical protein
MDFLPSGYVRVSLLMRLAGTMEHPVSDFHAHLMLQRKKSHIPAKHGDLRGSPTIRCLRADFLSH